MSFAAAVVLFPLLFWLLSGGCGLLVERLLGARLPAALVLPVGFGTLIVVSQFTTWVGALAPITPILLAVLAVCGLIVSRAALRERWASRVSGWWLLVAAMVGTYLIVAAPEIVAGRLTFSGYLLDTTGAIQVAGAERLLHHAHAFSTGLPAYGTTLQAYFGNGYPSGGHSVLAAVGWLSGQNLVWLYSIFQALELSMLALVLSYLARRAGLGPLLAALTGVIASVPALLYAYALMGSIKEITALPMLVGMAALVLCSGELRARAGLRAVLPFAILAAGALDAIGLAASPWVGLFGLCALLVAVPPLPLSRNGRALIVGAGGLVVATAVLGLPTLGPLGKTLSLAEGVSSSNSLAVADPGNLLRPLKFFQSLGVWLGESHRFEPRYLNQTYVLMGIVAVSIGLGLTYLLRRRAWGLLAFVVVSVVVWAILHSRGTTWADAKLLVILSPVLVFVALIGAFGLAEGRRIEGLLLGGVIAFGVLASDALLYHATGLAPSARFEELASIGERFAGQGPTMAPDFDEYSVYLLRNMAVDMPGSAYSGPFSFVEGATKTYGHSYDLDTVALGSVERFRTLVLRRSPAWSRPPGNFSEVRSGRYYTVWHRDGPAPLAHVPLGGGWTPSVPAPCRVVAATAALARRSGRPISYAPRAENISADLAAAAHTPNVGLVTDLAGRPQLAFSGPARVEGTLRVPSAGRYEVSLGGAVDRPIHVYIDGRLLGAPSQQSGGDGTTIPVASVTLGAGRHSWRLTRGGGNLSPDDASSNGVDGLILEPSTEGGRVPVASVPASRWRSLCGRPLDWLEVG